MLIAAIPVKNYLDAKDKIKQVIAQIDGVELRLDYLDRLNLDEIDQLRREFSIPLIFVLRKQSQGGYYPREESHRLSQLLALCALKPDYLDLEYDTPNDFIATLKRQFPDIKLIKSYHHFNETPLNLAALLQSMQDPHCHSYKIAVKANSTLDALRMLAFIQQHPNVRLTGISMGEYGQCTRVLSPIIGNEFHYASLNESERTAPNQLTVTDLLSTYHFRQLNRQTKVYALLGDPIHLSLGHILHNQVIRLLGKNAVYIKLRVTPEELPETLPLCRRLPFHGFSVTMPLKETIVPLLDQIEPSSLPIRAINTVHLQQQKYIGSNTDGLGAIQALSATIPVRNQKLLILGAGGAARAIAYEAHRQQAQVIIVNRTLDRAKKIADELPCEAYELNNSDVQKIPYTAIINTLPEKAYSDPGVKEFIQSLLPRRLAMEIVYHPIFTPFVRLAQQAGCVCIPGYAMYINQALLQHQRWFNPNENQQNEIRNLLKNRFSMRG